MTTPVLIILQFGLTVLQRNVPQITDISVLQDLLKFMLY